MARQASSGPSFVKNLIIALLAVVVVVQFILLLGGGETTAPPVEQAQETVGDGVRLVGVSFADSDERAILVSFNEPVGQDSPGPVGQGEVPASLRPEVAGQWSWASPYVLTFTADNSLPMGTAFKVSVDPERLALGGKPFTGPASADLVTEPFTVKANQIRTRAIYADGPKAILTGTIELSAPVSPRDLAANLTLVDPLSGKPVNLAVTTTYPSRSMGWRSEPLPRTPDPREVSIILSGDLTPRGGGVKLGKEMVWKAEIVLDTTLTVKGVDAATSLDGPSRITVRFSAPVAPKAASQWISLTPEAKYAIMADGEDLFLQGDMKPGTTYSLSLAKGLPALDGASLPQPYTQELAMPDIAPAVDFMDQGVFLSPKLATALRITSVNTPTAHLAVDRIYQNNIFYFLRYQSYAFFSERDWNGPPQQALGDRLTEEDIRLGGGQNQPRETVIDLRDYFDVTAPGLYRIMVTMPGEYEGSQRWLLISDLGLVAKKAPDQVLVWASSFKNLASISGAKISLVSNQNQVLATGTTDGNGLCSLEGTPDLWVKKYPFMVTAEKGGQFSFLTFDSFALDTAGLDVGGVSPTASRATAFIYGERDLYRPGETAHLAAIVRDSGLRTPKEQPYRARLRSPQGKEMALITATGGNGSAGEGWLEFSFDTALFWPTGGYQVELLRAEDVIGRYRFSLEEFVPDRIKAEVAGARARSATGGPLDFTVTSRYLFGPPAAGLPVEVSVSLEEAPFAPKEFAAYDFGNPDLSFTPPKLASLEERLDDQGEYDGSVELPGGLKPPASLAAVVQARVRESGGRGVTARTRLPVDPYPYYLGLKRPERRDFTPGKEAAFKYVAVSPAGERTAAGRLRAELVRDRWQTVVRTLPSGSFRYESVRDSRVVAAHDLDGASGAGSVAFSPADPGSYRVVLTDPATGASASQEFFVSGSGYSPWAVKNPGRVEIVAGKKEYAPGDTAVFQIRTPFPGKALVTIEGAGVLERKIITLKGNTAEAHFTVKEAYAPNVYASVVLVRAAAGLEPGMVACAYGAVPLTVNVAGRKLGIAIQAPEEIRPETSLKITASTRPGARLTLAAVDLGVLNLVGQKTPDPFAYFYAKAGLDVGSYATFAKLLPEVGAAGKSPAGGGMAMAARADYVSTAGMLRVKPVAFWSGVLTADKEGNAKFEVEVPSFQGALRIMAVAAKGEGFGSAEKNVVVKSPLVLMPTFPRFLASGDTARVPVTVRNDTAGDGDFNLELTATGPIQVEQAGQTLAIPKGSERTGYFEVTALETPGVAELAARVSGQGESSADSAMIPVRSPLPAVSLERTGALEETETLFPVERPEEFVAETLTRSATIGESPLIPFAGKLKYLLGYPHGCLEQTVSKAFPLIHFAALAKGLDPEDFGDLSPEAMVQRAISAASAMQSWDGGFSYWPTSSVSDPWLSLYTSHFLTEASLAGFSINQSMLVNAFVYVHEQAKAADGGDAQLVRSAYAAFILALAGAPDTGTMDYLRDKRLASMPDFAASLLAAAYSLSGNPGAAMDVLDFSQVQVADSRNSGGNLGSPVRNLAMAVIALEEIDPSDSRTLAAVRELSRRLSSGGSFSTQETALGFMALGRFLADTANTGPFSGSLFLGDTDLGSFDQATGITVRGVDGLDPLRAVLNEGSTPKAAFYDLIQRGAPTTEAYAPQSAGLTVSRELLTREGAPFGGTLAQGDLLVVKTMAASQSGPVDNVAVSLLLPAGLEVENPRLTTSETLDWIKATGFSPAYQDIRDDRVVVFCDLPDQGDQGDQSQASEQKGIEFYSLLRAVMPGEFSLPPVSAEAMYDPNLKASGELGRISVEAAK